MGNAADWYDAGCAYRKKGPFHEPSKIRKAVHFGNSEHGIDASVGGTATFSLERIPNERVAGFSGFEQIHQSGTHRNLQGCSSNEARHGAERQLRRSS